MKLILTAITALSLSFSAFADVAKGKEIFATCAACHGQHAEGSVGPQLQGRDKDYIVSKLKDYRANMITTPMASMMSPQAMDLTDSDIENVAEYITSLR